MTRIDDSVTALAMVAALGIRVLALPASVVPAHANAWNAAAVTAGATSTAVDTGYGANCAIFGNVNGAATLTVQYSQDNTNYYDGPAATVTQSSDFRIDAVVGARWIRLKNSATTTITATIACKT